MLIIALALAGSLGIQDPPQPPTLPGRPPPLAIGEAFGGVLGLACDDRQGEDGRWFNDHELSLPPGGRIGLNVSSTDFAPLLRVIDDGGEVLAEIEAAADGKAAGFVFTAAGERSREMRPPLIYRIRVTSAAPAGVGAWRVEKNYDGQIDVVFPGEAVPFPVRTGCQPMPPITRRRSAD